MRAILLVTTCLVLLGCSTAASPSVAPPTPTVAAPTATAAATETTTALTIQEFASHTADTLTEILTNNAALSTALGDEDPVGILSATGANARLVEVEIAWLDEHPPQACYAALHRQARAIFEAVQKASIALGEAVEAWPIIDDAKMASGQNYVELAGREFQTVNEMMEAGNLCD